MAGSEEDQGSMCEIVYYGREKLYHHIQRVVLEGRRRKGVTPLLSFWNAFSMMMDGSVAEAMQEFKQIHHRDVILCTTLALIHAHKLSPTVDREAVQKLDTKMREERKTCGEMGWYHAAMFLWMVGRHDKAREYVGRVLKGSPDNVEALTLYGWIDLTCGRDSLMKKSVEYFDRALSVRDNVEYIPPDCFLGKAKFFEMRKELAGALDLVNLAVVDHPTFTPVLVEKCRILLALRNWEQCYDTSQRALTQSPPCIDAHRYQALWLQCKAGRSQEAAERLAEVIEVIDRSEPRNHRLYCETARIFSRVAGGSQYILQQTEALLDRARSLAPTVADYVVEAGNQAMMRSKGNAVRDANKLYREALKMDETSVSALTGIIWCQLLEGDVEDAEQQLDFLMELQSAIGQSSELFYLRAILCEKKGLPAVEIVDKLRETQKYHSDLAKQVAVGFEYFVSFNPDFTLRLIKSLMKYATEDESSSVKLLHSCEVLLEELTARAPGLIEALYLTAKLWILKGDLSRAQTGLAQCIKLDPTYSSALLLSAELALKKGDVALCKQQLDLALSHNFEVRESPHFHLLRARSSVLEDNFQAAEESLKTAVNLPGVKRTENTSIPLAERAVIFVELCAVYQHLGKTADAMSVITEAKSLFDGTSEQLRIRVAHADLLVATDVDGALAMLRSISPTDAYYAVSRQKMAEIYLMHRKDHRMYIKCFEELTENAGTAHCYDLLGDALMVVKEHGRAIESYQSAIKMDPRNGRLASKAGKAMVRTHNYNRAITYYETAVKLGKQTHLRYDLAELHMKLRQYDKVDKVVEAALAEETGDDIQSRMERVKFLLLRANVCEKVDVQRALDTLNIAKDQQSKVLRVLQGVDAPASELEQHRRKAADICCQSATLFASRRDHEAAVRFYQEALLYLENYEKALVALAEMYLSMNNLEACYQHCTTILRYVTDHEVATMMIGEVQFRKEQYDLATFHFEQLLERSPTNFVALSRLIDLMRRLGKLSDSLDFIKEAEKRCVVTTPAGLHYCKGLFKRYSGNPTEALHGFNLARKDKEWGERAIYQMIDICIYPEGETIGGDALAAVDSDSGTQSERLDSQEMALKTAERLMKEWQPSTQAGKVRRSVVEGHLRLRSKSRDEIEDGIELFMSVMQPNGEGQVEDNVSAIVGLITGYMMIKQLPRARTQMKRIAKRVWNFDEAEDLERGWLLMADHYVASNRSDDANKTIQRIVQYNQSCSKAWEYRGHLHEKDGKYADAAMNYENAWRFSSQSNAVIGYKLAFNYMKAQRHVDAVEVCYKVLELHPKYPRIRKDILDKARASIRL